MSAILAARDSIVAALLADARLAGVTVEAVGGKYTVDDLLRDSRKAPALIVAGYGFDAETQDGSTVTQVLWVVLAIADDRGAVPRDRGVISLTDTAVRVLSPLFPATTGPYGRLHDFKARNMFGTKFDEHAIAVWSITCKQNIELVDDVPDTGDPLESVHAKYYEPGKAPTAWEE